MALKFRCSICDEDIITKFLKVGEAAKCRSCGAQNVVPETAVETDQKPDYLRQSPIIPQEVKTRLQAKIEQARTERIERITEGPSNNPVSSDVEETTSIASMDKPIAHYDSEQTRIASVTNWVVYCVTYLLIETIGFWPALSGIIIGLIILFATCGYRWRKQSWEGVVIGKSWYICNTKYISDRRYCVEVCCDQTVQKRDLTKENWESIEIGDCVIKRSGSSAIEKRAIREEKARETTPVLTQRLSHKK